MCQQQLKAKEAKLSSKSSSAEAAVAAEETVEAAVEETVEVKIVILNGRSVWYRFAASPKLLREVKK